MYVGGMLEGLQLASICTGRSSRMRAESGPTVERRTYRYVQSYTEEEC